MVSNKLNATVLPCWSWAGPASREYSSAKIDSAEYSPVLMSATGGPGLAGSPGRPVTAHAQTAYSRATTVTPVSGPPGCRHHITMPPSTGNT